MGPIEETPSASMNYFQQNDFDLSLFTNPSPDYRPIVFWSWNEIIETQEIKRQLRLMKEAGLGSGFIHSRIGLLTDYLGDEWFEAVQATIDESKRLGFKVYLYDEDKWPSGFAGGTVPMKSESFRLKAILARPAGCPVPENCTSVGPVTEGIQLYRWVSPLGYDWFNGTCYTDLMDKEAVKYFIEQSYVTYYEKFSEHFGDEIVFQFTDEPCSIFRGRLPRGAVPYTDALPETFQRLHGYEPLGMFYKLFLNDKGAEQFRIHYFRTINYLFEKNFSEQISRWCSDHKIGLTGHYMLEGEMYGQQLWGTKVMGNYRHQHQPGIDHLGRQIDEIISAKQCQSVVNQFSKKRMLSELYGGSGQNLSFEDRLWLATQQIQLGVNFLNPHLCLYTMSGCRKRDFPPNLFYQQPWWPVNEAIDTPLSRLCYAMSQGEYVADVLVLHPQESAFALWCTKYEDCSGVVESNNMEWDMHPVTDDSHQMIEDLDKTLKKILSTLLDSQVQYDLGDETIIADSAEISVEAGKVRLCIGAMKYSTVILPEMYTISKESVALLKQFSSKGGQVFRCGQGPLRVDGRKTPDLELFIQSIPKYDISQLVNRLTLNSEVQLIEKEGEGRLIWAHHRRLAVHSSIVMVSNLNRSVFFRGAVAIEGQYKAVWLLDHWTGNKVAADFYYDGNKTVLDLDLESTQSRLLLFDHAEPGEKGMSLSGAREHEMVKLNAGEIAVKVLDKNSLVLDKAKFSTDDQPLSSKAIPLTVIQSVLNEEKYSGELRLEYSFEVESWNSQNKASLVVEHPEYYKIYVNGSECCFSDRQSWLDIRFIETDVTDHIIQGINTVQLVCDTFVHGDQTNVHDMFARYGTEIESIYINGNFSVKGEYVKPIYDHSYWDKWGLEPDLLMLKDGSLKLGSCQSLLFNDEASSGLPFYAGRIEYSVKLPDIGPKSDSSVFLSLEKLNAACAEIYVNGACAGRILSRPYELDISEYYEPGGQLMIILYSTLRNLLGPHHDKDGEPIFVSPLSFLPETNEGQGYSDLVSEWLDESSSPSDWNEDYCLVNFGSIGEIILKYF